MVQRTLSLVQKGETSGCSGCSHTVDTVHSGCSEIVIYGGGDIVFGAKMSNQWMEWTQYVVDAVRSGRSMQWMQWSSYIWW